MVLWDPVTVSCGHSFCRRCLGETLPSECCLCGEKLGLLGSRTPSSNVLLGNLLEKGLDTTAKVARLKRDLRELVSNRDFQEALRSLQKGIALGKVCVLSRDDAFLESVARLNEGAEGEGRLGDMRGTDRQVLPGYATCHQPRWLHCVSRRGTILGSPFH